MDGNGKFPIDVHVAVETKYGGVPYFIAAATNYMADFVQADNNAIHFDNCQNFGDVKNIIDNAGGFEKLNNHSIGDFFSHSNYADIWTSLSVEKKVSGQMPLWDEVDWNSEFGKALMDPESGLRTTAYPDEGQSNGHDNGYDKKIAGNDNAFGSKDKPDKVMPPIIYQYAIDAFIRAIKSKSENQ